jgi:cytochrome c-type biogenesis protein CcmE
MVRSHKPAVGRVVAVAAVLLVASAFVWTSLLAGGPGELTASQLLTRAQPGTTYVLDGTVLEGSVRRTGSSLYFRVRDAGLQSSVAVRYTREIPDPFANGRAARLDVHEVGRGEFIGEAGSLTTNVKKAGFPA